MNSTTDIAKIILNKTKEKNKGTDAAAKVVRIDGDIAYVHIDGGAPETPCQLTLSCKVGDEVKIRIAKGKCWITGNVSSPPTDDTEVNKLKEETNSWISKISNSLGNMYSQIRQTAKEIELKVSKDGIISAINQTAETIKIQAAKINLEGYVTMRNLETDGETTISGGNIKTGVISGYSADDENGFYLNMETGEMRMSGAQFESTGDGLLPDGDETVILRNDQYVNIENGNIFMGFTGFPSDYSVLFPSGFLYVNTEDGVKYTHKLFDGNLQTDYINTLVVDVWADASQVRLSNSSAVFGTYTADATGFYYFDLTAQFKSGTKTRVGLFIQHQNEAVSTGTSKGAVVAGTNNPLTLKTNRFVFLNKGDQISFMPWLEGAANLGNWRATGFLVVKTEDTKMWKGN